MIFKNKKTNKKLKTALIFTVCLCLFFALVFAIGQVRQKENRAVDFFKKNTGAEISLPENYLEPAVFKNQNKILEVLPLAGFNARAEKDGDKYIYREAYEHTDVIQSKFENRIKEEIVFYEPGHPLEFEYNLGNYDDFYVKENSQGNWEFYDKEIYNSGQPPALARLFTLFQPFLKDNSGNISYEAAGLSLKDGLLKITVDQAWLKNAKYPVVLDPIVEINLINAHSYPQEGDNWVVGFTTFGRGDLYITPADEATVADDDFVSLTCDGEARSVKILPGDQIYFPDWECDGVGVVTHYTIKKGNHTLLFDFAGQEEVAYNANWWNVNWGKRRKITFDTTSSATTTDLLNFPAAIQLNSSRIDYSKTQNSGQDIRFVDSDDSTPLDYEIELWNESGTSTVWVEVPQIDQNSNTDFIWMYYDNPTASDGSSITGTWNGDYVAVHHMDDSTTSSIDDSTSNGIDGTKKTASNPDQISGKISYAQDFDNATEYVTLTDHASLTWTPVTESRTLTTWFNPQTTPTNGGNPFQFLIATNVAAGDNHYQVAYLQNGGTTYLGVLISPNSWGSTIGYFLAPWSPSNGTWYHIAIAASSAGNNRVYVNGQPLTIIQASWDDNTEINPTGSGIKDINNNSSGTGYLDEWRWSSIARTDDWIEFEYCNVVESCISYASEENYNYAPTISSVVDAPDPVAAGDVVNWTVDWNDADFGEMIKVFVCKTNAITTSTPACSSGTWATSPVFTNRDPENLVDYVTTVTDIGTQNYYVFVCDDSQSIHTACSNSSSGSFTVQEQSPDQPGDLLVENMPNPVNIATTTPRFSAIYNDPNIGDIANKYCIHINTASDFTGTDMWISDGAGCGTGSAMSNCVQGERCQDIYYNGSSLSLDAAVYYWRINFWDDSGNLSASSTVGTFTMANGGTGVRLQGGNLKGGVRLE